MAGARERDRGSRPCSRARCSSAAGSPGMPAASALFKAFSRSRRPSAARNSSARAPAGEVSRASRNPLRPSAWRSRKKPPPPRPELEGSTTAKAALTATAASKALPPARSTSKPASVASGWALAIAASPGEAPRAGARTSRRRHRADLQPQAMSKTVCPHPARSDVSRWYLASSSSGLSRWSGSGRQHSTGQTTWHCGSS